MENTARIRFEQKRSFIADFQRLGQAVAEGDVASQMRLVRLLVPASKSSTTIAKDFHPNNGTHISC